MIRLQNKPNVQAPTVAYPFGKSTDNTGTNNGFPLNSETLEDYHQFFEKMFAESGLVANGLPDNATNGFQLWNAFRKLARPYKVYTAIVSQSGTAAPSATILLNELGTVTFARIGTGVYTMTFTTPLTATNKVFFTFNNSDSNHSRVVFTVDSVTQITIYKYNAAGAAADTLFFGSTVEVRLYD